MTDTPSNTGSRDELISRLTLVEEMIAQGRRSTARYGWFFLMWGVIYYAAIAWCLYLPHPDFAWPVCILFGVATIFIVKARRAKQEGCRKNAQYRGVEAAWQMMGLAICLFVFTAILTHHANSPAYFAAILFFIGLAHATSAAILRWRAQALTAAIWWIGGIASLIFSRPGQMLAIFLGATFFGMILFGVYAMVLDSRRAAGQLHA